MTISINGTTGLITAGSSSSGGGGIATNTALGGNALVANTTGATNTACGNEALKANTTASGNTAVGYQALYSSNRTADANAFNTAVGYNAGNAVTTGQGNAFIGNGSGSTMTTGSNNVIVGGYTGNNGALDMRTLSNYVMISDGAGNARGIFDSGGRLLLNQTANNGTALLQMICPVSTDGILIKIGTNGTNAMSFLNAGGAANVGSIAVNLASTAYNTSSDYRLKDNILPMTGALAIVSELKPCTYTWKIDGSDGQGFIAHELAEVVPDAVTGEKDAVETYTDEDGNEQTRIKPQGIDTSFLVATLTAALQELKAIVDAQAIEIAELKAK